jgi:MurNAc alpha-1-phosphate uridylyltransferase
MTGRAWWFVTESRLHQCAILAGGLGTRMRPATEIIPKALIPVCGRPFAHYQLEWLASQGVREVLYLIGYHGAQIRNSVGDGERFGLSISYLDDGEKLRGTGGALRNALEHGLLENVFAVLYGDSYLTIDLSSVSRAFRVAAQPALLTVFPNENGWDRSNAVYERGQVVLYEKAPRGRPDPRMNWIDAGLSLLARQVVERIASNETADLADVYRELSLEGALAGFEVTTRFYEVGSPAGRAELEDHLRRKRNAMAQSSNRRADRRRRASEGAKLTDCPDENEARHGCERDRAP